MDLLVDKVFKLKMKEPTLMSPYLFLRVRVRVRVRARVRVRVRVHVYYCMWIWECREQDGTHRPRNGTCRLANRRTFLTSGFDVLHCLRSFSPPP